MTRNSEVCTDLHRKKRSIKLGRYQLAVPSAATNDAIMAKSLLHVALSHNMATQSPVSMAVNGPCNMNQNHDSLCITDQRPDR